jgi:hypothetical protein
VLVYSIVAESSFQDLEEIHENIVRIKDRDDVRAVPSCCSFLFQRQRFELLRACEKR